MKSAAKQILGIKCVEEQIKGFFTDNRIVKQCNCCGNMHTFKNIKQVRKLASHVALERDGKPAMHSFNCNQCETPLYFKPKD